MGRVKRVGGVYGFSALGNEAIGELRASMGERVGVGKADGGRHVPDGVGLQTELMDLLSQVVGRRREQAGIAGSRSGGGVKLFSGRPYVHVS